MITEELFIAYTQCPYKAYCLLYFKNKAIPNEYATILKSERTYTIKGYINQLKKNKLDVQRYSKEKLLRSEADSLINAVLRLDEFRTFCPVLVKNESTNSYEPIVFTGQHTISKQDQIALSYIGYILTGIQGGEPGNGKVITRNNKAHNIKLTDCTQKAKLIIEPLEELINQSDTDPPTLILNKSCSYCEFESFCRAVAKEQDSLSLLHGISTKKAINKYKKKETVAAMQSFLLSCFSSFTVSAPV